MRWEVLLSSAEYTHTVGWLDTGSSRPLHFVFVFSGMTEAAQFHKSHLNEGAEASSRDDGTREQGNPASPLPASTFVLAVNNVSLEDELRAWW